MSTYTLLKGTSCSTIAIKMDKDLATVAKIDGIGVNIYKMHKADASEYYKVYPYVDITESDWMDILEKGLRFIEDRMGEK